MGDAADSLRADVLIAGSGPIACTFARYLVDGGFNALIADSGPHYSKRRGAHLRNAVEYQSDIDRFTPVIMRLLDPYSLAPRSKNAAGLDPLFFQNEAGQVPTRSALNPRQDPCRNLTGAAASHAVGGMFIHWTNNVPRQHPSLERTKLIDHEEWEDLYSAAEKLVNMHTDIYTNSVRQTIIKRILTAHYGSQPFFHGIQDMPVAAERRRDNPEFVTFSGSDTILGPLADREDGGHLTIMPEHRVTSMKQQGGRIVSAELCDMRSRARKTAEADIFIIACGAVHTSQLLWASNIRPRALGHYLSDHIFAFCQIVLKEAVIKEMGAEAVRRGFAADRHSRDPIPIPMKDPPPHIWIPVSESRPWHCQVQRDVTPIGGIPADIDGRLVVDLQWFGMIDPVYENHVRFEEDMRDKFGMPQPTFEFSYGDEDKGRASNMMADMVDAAGALGGFLAGSEPRFT